MRTCWNEAARNGQQEENLVAQFDNMSRSKPLYKNSVSVDNYHVLHMYMECIKVTSGEMVTVHVSLVK